MPVKQTIIIIGTELMGREIAGRLAGGDFHILLCDEVLAKAEALVGELKQQYRECDVEAAPCRFDGAWEADIIILAMPFEHQQEVAGMIKEVVNQKILVSAVYPAAPIVPINAIACSHVRRLQELLPHTRIVSIYDEKASPGTSSFFEYMSHAFIAGKDDQSVAVIAEILQSAGVKEVSSTII